MTDITNPPDRWQAPEPAQLPELRARLVDTGPICYPTPDGLTWRPARTWQLPGLFFRITVITELGDGPPVSEYTEHIRKGLQAAHGSSVRLVEHHPKGMYIERYLTLDGDERLQIIPAARMLQLLGPSLVDSSPTGPVVNGVWPSAHQNGATT